MTKAQDALFAFGLGLELKAYEFCYDNAVSVRTADDHDVVRFDDNTKVKVYMNDDHEITILEA